MSSRSSQSGFSMIELMIALVVLMVGVLGVLALQKTVYGGASVAKHYSQATHIAEMQMEELRVGDPATLTTINALTNNELVETVDEAGTTDADGFFTRTTEVILNDTLATITVDVSWREGKEDFDRHAQALTTRTISN